MFFSVFPWKDIINRAYHDTAAPARFLRKENNTTIVQSCGLLLCHRRFSYSSDGGRSSAWRGTFLLDGLSQGGSFVCCHLSFIQKNRVLHQGVLLLHHIDDLLQRQCPVHRVEVTWDCCDQTLVSSLEQHVVLNSGFREQQNPVYL